MSSMQPSNGETSVRAPAPIRAAGLEPAYGHFQGSRRKQLSMKSNAEYTVS